jgi:adenosylcobinamide amidohydrolase
MKLPLATIISESPDHLVQRHERYLVVFLKTGHRVLSTSPAQGGLVETVRYLVNHQSMEASNHNDRFEKIIALSAQQYHQSVADELKIDESLMAMMGTAASMNHVSHVYREYKNLRVDVLVTAGVHGNALRSGDTSHWAEGKNGNERVDEVGTINTIVLINQPLLPGAMAKAAMVMTEAKSSVLQELAVCSRESTHIATGTGTDQYIIASPVNDKVAALESASGHLKLGELIGTAVRDATLEALRWQSSLERSSTRSVTHALGRYGLTEQYLFDELKEALPTTSYELLHDNRTSVLTEPRVVASAYAFAAVLDRLQYGTLSSTLAAEVIKDQAANVAVSVSAQSDRWPEYWKNTEVSPNDLIHSFVSAVAMGWQHKW